MTLATIWSAAADPWGQAIMQRAFVEVILLAIAGGALGCWVIYYNLAYSAESLAHSLLPGLVIAALTGIPLLLGGAVGILVAALAVAAAGRVPSIGRDTAVAVVVTTFFGLGVLLALSPAAPAGLQGLLFGDVLGVSDTDLLLAGVLVVVTLISLRLLHGRLLLVGFDRTTAGSFGVRPVLIDAALLTLLAAAILVAVQGLGTLLVVAVLVAPAAAASLVTGRMGTMVLVSIATAVVTGIGGLYVSYYADTAAGASIALALVAVGLVLGGASAARGRGPRGSLARS